MALYRTTIEQTHNPEYVSALATIVRRTDSPAADALESSATKSYERQFALYPEAAGGHFIRHLLAAKDAPVDRLLSLAKQNAALRPNGEARLLLAKAYSRAGMIAEAREELRAIRRTPWRTPELEAFERELRRAPRATATSNRSTRTAARA